jgi:hypothetical protein
MSKPLKLAFDVTVKGEDGRDKAVRLAVRPPSAQVKQAGRLVHGKAYNDAVQAGVMLREELEGHLRKSRLWDDERQAEYERLRKAILDGERRLAKGGLRLKEARSVALAMTRARSDLQDLLAQRNRVDSNTADAIADQAQFNYFVASCTVYDDTGKPFFTADGEHPSVDVYVERGTEEAAITAANKLSEIMFGSDREIRAKLPENQFLRRFNFIDEEFHLIDAKGRRVDEEGRLVDSEGRFVNEAGEYVDADGNRVDADGRYVVEEAPFLDDDGNPIGDEGAAGEQDHNPTVGDQGDDSTPPAPNPPDADKAAAQGGEDQTTVLRHVQGGGQK